MGRPKVGGGVPDARTGGNGQPEPPALERDIPQIELFEVEMRRQMQPDQPGRTLQHSDHRPTVPLATTERDGLLQLQRSVGNRGMLALLARGQAKLTVGAADDPHEREADAVASQVLARLAERAPAVPAGTGEPGEVVARRVSRCRHPAGRIGPEGGGLDRDTEAAIEGARRGGRPFDGELRRKMETAFGADFSSVKLHAGSEAAALNEAVGAQAFTVGADIFLGRGAPALESTEGQGLLAHELTHTVQQGGAAARASRSLRRFPATALANPPIPAVDWGADTASVAKAGEGKSGGVFFVKTKNARDAIQSLVVKPSFGVNANLAIETAPQLAFGDRAVSSLFGIGAPTSRIVSKGTAEFNAIVATIGDKDVPPTDRDDRQYWKPVREAPAMIVMGAVPSASSLSALAEKAMDDPHANERLHDAVFAKPFLFDLGKLMVADLLIGNDDRMVAGAMNIGNLMVSSTGDGHKLYAIDTRAVLGEFDPLTVLDKGSASLVGGFNSTRTHFDREPGEYLDGFFDTLKRWYRGGPEKERAWANTAPEGALDPGELLLLTYQARRDEALRSFTAGFEDGMATVTALATTPEGQEKMKGLTGEFDGQQGSEEVQYLPLRTNAHYLSNRAQGKSHEESSRGPAASAALAQLIAFDPARYRIPEDEYFWNAARIPSSDVYNASLEDLGVFPQPTKMSIGARSIARSTVGTYSEADLRELGIEVGDAKTAIDALGTKKRGLSNKEQPRNRVSAGHFIANAFLLGAGGVRAASYAKRLHDLATLCELATSVKMDRVLARQAMPAAQFVLDHRQRLQRDLDEYVASLTAASKAMRKLRRFPQKDQMVEVLDAVAGYVPRCGERFLGSKQVVGANLYLNLLKSAR